MFKLFRRQLQHLPLKGKMFRTGFGYDVHRLVKGRPLIIGGIKIPYAFGLEGHSDADVLIHALMDGILGAMGRGDIGGHFPDNDPAYKGIDSTLLLKRVMELVKQDGYSINNVDTTIVAQSPKIAPFIETMREKLSQILEISPCMINIKATTTEGMGFCGRGEGIAAYSVVTIVKSKAV